MAHGRVLDYALGRHYCPSCGKAAGFREDSSYDKRKLRWYQIAPVRHYCNACGTQVRAHLKNGIWIAIPIWATLAMSFAFAFVTFKDQGLISGNGMQTAAFIFVILFSAGFLFQIFFSYEIANDAP